MIKILALIACVHVKLFSPAVWQFRFHLWHTTVEIQQLKLTLFLIRLFKN